ncbi:uncharacterized protein LOC128343737 [Hemicordylus capensis]|uniref:uncharacterized protein LOC128343737 n=1 Tax=Hemicordylus capensis TaxID=884348 RepID=UPI0023034DEE|nr:uncharacterized protein LOC128343737 [Hemicordylus capensis]
MLLAARLGSAAGLLQPAGKKHEALGALIGWPAGLCGGGASAVWLAPTPAASVCSEKALEQVVWPKLLSFWPVASPGPERLCSFEGPGRGLPFYPWRWPPSFSVSVLGGGATSLDSSWGPHRAVVAPLLSHWRCFCGLQAGFFSTEILSERKRKERRNNNNNNNNNTVPHVHVGGSDLSADLQTLGEAMGKCSSSSLGDSAAMAGDEDMAKFSASLSATYPQVVNKDEWQEELCEFYKNQERLKSVPLWRSHSYCTWASKPDSWQRNCAPSEMHLHLRILIALAGSIASRECIFSKFSRLLRLLRTTCSQELGSLG